MIWNLSRFQIVKKITIPGLELDFELKKFSASLDRRYFSTGTQLGKFKLFDFTNLKILFHHEPSHQGEIHFLILNKNETLLYSGGDEGVVKVWDTKKLEFIGDLQSFQDDPSQLLQISAGMIDNEDKFLFIGDSIGRVWVWNFSSKNWTLIIDFEYEGEVVSICQTGNLIIAANFLGNVVCFDVGTFEIIWKKTTANIDFLNNIFVSNDSKFLVCLYNLQKWVVIYNLQTFENLIQFEFKDGEPPTDVGFSPQNSSEIYFSSQSYLAKIDMDSDERIILVNDFQFDAININDKNMLAISEQSICIWDLKNLSLKSKSKPIHESTISAWTFSRKNNCIFTGSSEGTLKFTSLKNIYSD